MDSRLELEVHLNSEITLKKLIMKNTQQLMHKITVESMQQETISSLNPWPDTVESIPEELHMTNIRMLEYCFASLFENLQNQDPSKIDQILQLWLTLNIPTNKENFTPSIIPQIQLDCVSIHNLISTMAWTPGLSLATWCLALQTVTLVCNLHIGKKWIDSSWMIDTIVNHPSFVPLLLSLLSGTGPIFSGKDLVSIITMY